MERGEQVGLIGYHPGPEVMFWLWGGYVPFNLFVMKPKKINTAQSLFSAICLPLFILLFAAWQHICRPNQALAMPYILMG